MGPKALLPQYVGYALVVWCRIYCANARPDARSFGLCTSVKSGIMEERQARYRGFLRMFALIHPLTSRTWNCLQVPDDPLRTTACSACPWAATGSPWRAALDAAQEGTMAHIYNGMPSSELAGISWQKSAHSNPNGACVEVAVLPDGEIAVRNSRFPGGPALIYTRGEIDAFLAGAKDGEFDHVLN